MRPLLGALNIDPGLQTRAAMNDATVAEYADALLAGEVLPPVVVFRDGEGMWLADGFHRVAAAEQAGVADIEAIVHDGGRREALLHAVGANARHGLRRTNADKRRAVEMMLADAEWARWSDRVVAEKCGVDHKTVAAVRANLTGEIPQCSARMTADGRVMETVKIGRKAADAPAPVEPLAIRLVAVNLRPVDQAPANDDGPAFTPPANGDAEDAPDVRLIAELDAAGATVVRLLAVLAVDQPEAARRFGEQHVRNVNAALP